MKYRPDIDGLRALAVVSVILFHADLELFSGGYVGVDVFFVISGFLITKNLIQTITDNTFSLLTFYEKRMRRILPALFTTFFVTSVFAYIILTPYQKSDYGLSVLFASLSVSNIFFYKNVSYFDTGTFEKPLLNTWSLGVEEQFYFFIPILTLFVLRAFGKRILTLCFLFLATCSFALSVYKSGINNDYNYYLLQTRAWELLAGALLAALNKDLFKNTKVVFIQLLYFTGLLLVLVPIFVYDSSTLFPGLAALPIILGSALLISLNRVEGYVYKVLSLKGITFIGLISYSAYLVHYPLFAFYKLSRAKSFSFEKAALFILITFTLAWVMWKFIETPFRKRGFLKTKTIYITSFIGVMLFAVTGWGVYKFKKIPEELNNPISKIIKHRPSYHGKYLAEGDYQLAAKRRPIKGEKNLLIIGDSYSQDFYNMILEAKGFQSYNIYTRYIPSACQPVYHTEKTVKLVRTSRRKRCLKESMASVVTEEDIALSDVVVFVSSWKRWAVTLVEESIAKVSLLNKKEVFLLGSKEFGVNAPALITKLWKNYDELKDKEFPVSEEFLKTNEEFKVRKRDFYEFINLHEAICPNRFTCKLTTDSGELISYDGGHLTKKGAEFIGKTLFTKTKLKRFKR